jgi:hypothetical protein
MIDIEMQEKIERYILGRIGPEEELELWIRFLEDREWFNYFIIELHLRSFNRLP